MLLATYRLHLAPLQTELRAADERNTMTKGILQQHKAALTAGRQEVAVLAAKLAKLQQLEM